MTENRCIKVLKKMKHMFTETCAKIDENTALNMAVEAIKEIQQYRAIGTVEELKEAKEVYNEILLSEGKINVPKECIAYEVGKLREKELREYKAIGTIEEFKALKEKNVAKKPLFGTVHNDTTYHCRSCQKFVGFYDTRRYEYCHNCGAKIDWSE